MLAAALLTPLLPFLYAVLLPHVAHIRLPFRWSILLSFIGMNTFNGEQFSQSQEANKLTVLICTSRTGICRRCRLACWRQPCDQGSPQLSAYSSPMSRMVRR